MKLKDNKILVTGGAGFIGSHLAERLAEDNFVRVVDDFSTGSWDNLGSLTGRPNVEIIEGTITDSEACREWCSGADLVFHLAVSCLRTSLNDPLASHDVNAGGSLNLCRAAQACAVDRFVYVSSSEVYGTALAPPMAEAHPREPTTVYGAAKLAGELYAQAYLRTYGLKTIIVRPFNTYGPREPWQGKRAEVIPRFILRMLAGQPPVIFGDGAQTRDFTYVDDTVQGLILAAACDRLVGQAINIARGREISISRITTLIGEMLGVELPAETAPARPGVVMRHWADVSMARDLLGFEARTDITEGLARSIDWFKAAAAERGLTCAQAGEANW